MENRRNNSVKRQAIYDCLCSTHEHPTAEMIYNSLKPHFPQLSLGTVYRNLNVLAEEGLVIRVCNVDGQERYDATTADHTHFVCRSCHRVLDVNLPDVVTALYAQIQNCMGCEAEGHNLTIQGLCDKCRTNQ